MASIIHGDLDAGSRPQHAREETRHPSAADDDRLFGTVRHFAGLSVFRH